MSLIADTTSHGGDLHINGGGSDFSEMGLSEMDGLSETDSIFKRHSVRVRSTLAMLPLQSKALSTVYGGAFRANTVHGGGSSSASGDFVVSNARPPTCDKVSGATFSMERFKQGAKTYMWWGVLAGLILGILLGCFIGVLVPA